MFIVGKPQYLGRNLNDFCWSIDKCNGVQFERLVQSHVRKSLTSCLGCTVRATNYQDKGKDIIIEFEECISLFGIELKCPAHKRKACIFIECKKSNKKTISTNFGSSLIQLDSESNRPDYFFLVTNSTITPYIEFNSKSKFNAVGCKFVLVDRYQLALDFNKLGFRPILSTETNNNAEPFVSYCIERDYTNHGTSLFLYLNIKNYKEEEVLVHLNLRSDVNWTVDVFEDLSASTDETFKCFIKPFEAVSIKLRLKKISFRAIDELRLGISIDDRPKTISISSRHVEFEFDPPLFGRYHSTLVEEIINHITKENPVRIVNLTGDAGTGKSKVLKGVIDILERRNILTASVSIRKQSENNSLREVVNFIKKRSGWGKKIPDNITPKGLIKLLLALPDDWMHYVICLEDVHHASQSFFKSIKEFIDIKTRPNITILLTGRDDSTFPNVDYFSFITFLNTNSQLGNIANLTLKPWDDKSCCDFIRQTIVSVPESVVSRIHTVSQNTPFGVIQSIEYFLDQKIVEVLNRNTVGILNGEHIASKNSLPDGVKNLISTRIRNIFREVGNDAYGLIVFMAYYGLSTPYEIVNEIINIQTETNVLEELAKKRIVQFSDLGIEFTHENIQAYLTELTTNKKIADLILKRISKSKKLKQQLDANKMGMLLFNAHMYKEAFACFSELYSELSSIDNISSADINPNIIPYIPAILNSAIQCYGDSTEIERAILASAYLYLHNSPLSIAYEGCDQLQKLLNSLKKNNCAEKRASIKLEQLKAHIFLNMGHVLSAEKIMKEIVAQAFLDDTLLNDYDLMFDVFDRLQNIYHQLNHKDLFVYYSELSKNIALQKKDVKLLSLVKASRAKEHYFDNPKRFFKETNDSTLFSVNNASSRHICHAKLNLCVAKALISYEEEGSIMDLIGEAHELLKTASDNAYSFSITRSELLIAVLYSLLGLNSEENRRKAERYANLGVESALRFGNGFFLWQLHNILAIIEMNELQPRNKIVNGHFETAMHYIEKQGLFFLGALDSCNLNLSVISNYLMYLEKYHDDRTTYSLLSKIHYYSKGQTNLRDGNNKLLKSVRDFKLIGRKRPLKRAFVEPNTGMFLCVR